MRLSCPRWRAAWWCHCIVLFRQPPCWDFLAAASLHILVLWVLELKAFPPLCSPSLGLRGCVVDIAVRIGLRTVVVLCIFFSCGFLRRSPSMSEGIRACGRRDKVLDAVRNDVSLARWQQQAPPYLPDLSSCGVALVYTTRPNLPPIEQTLSPVIWVLAISAPVAPLATSCCAGHCRGL